MLGFCAGRIDSRDGSESAELGPSALQEAYAPCEEQGACKEPLGSTTVGLIYLNPEGPMGNPDPVLSSADVRDAFGRMGMNDSETVALIGGGHAFGKTHGACPNGAGPSPAECATGAACTPWPGLCGSGKGVDAFTSGFEGPWTSKPDKWDNEYFKYLEDFTWEVHEGPGGSFQWRVNATKPGGEPSTGPAAPAAHGPEGSTQNVMMLTSDISLTMDPLNLYQPIVSEFSQEQAALDNAFKHAWYKLTSRDMGPVTRCFGNDVPAAQDWQFPLPAAPEDLADFEAVKVSVRSVIDSTPPPTNAAALFVRLSWQCGSTFRGTDHFGGCNGARIRFAPENAWPINKGLDKALTLLTSVKTEFGDALSWADLIVLAGAVGLEKSGAPTGTLEFIGGRTDADTGAGSKDLGETMAALSGGMADTAFRMKEAFKVMGMTNREMTALIGGGHTLGAMHEDVSGFTGAWTADSTAFTNSYFTNLLNEDWQEYTVPESGAVQYKATGKELYIMQTDFQLRNDSELLNYVTEYAGNQDLFFSDFAAAWNKVASADRFDLIDTTPTLPPSGESSGLSDSAIVGLSIGVPAVCVVAAASIFFMWQSSNRRRGITLTGSDLAPPVNDAPLLSEDYNDAGAKCGEDASADAGAEAGPVETL